MEEFRTHPFPPNLLRRTGRSGVPKCEYEWRPQKRGRTDPRPPLMAGEWRPPDHLTGWEGWSRPRSSCGVPGAGTAPWSPSRASPGPRGTEPRRALPRAPGNVNLAEIEFNSSEKLEFNSTENLEFDSTNKLEFDSPNGAACDENANKSHPPGSPPGEERGRPGVVSILVVPWGQFWGSPALFCGGLSGGAGAIRPSPRGDSVPLGLRATLLGAGDGRGRVCRARPGGFLGGHRGYGRGTETTRPPPIRGWGRSRSSPPWASSDLRGSEKPPSPRATAAEPPDPPKRFPKPQGTDFAGASPGHRAGCDWRKSKLTRKKKKNPIWLICWMTIGRNEMDLAHGLVSQRVARDKDAKEPGQPEIASVPLVPWGGFQPSLVTPHPRIPLELRPA